MNSLGFLRPVFAIAGVSAREILRGRLLYSAFLVCGVILTVGFLAARLSFISPERIMIDFGITAVSLCSCGVAILFGSSLISKEIERKTLFIILSRPVSKSQFVLGQYLGLSSVVLINGLLLSAAFLLVLVSTQSAGFNLLYAELWIALFLAIVEAVLLGAVAVFFSTFSTSTLSSFFTAGVYLVGTNAAEFKEAMLQGGSHVGGVARYLSYLLPHLEYFHLGTQVYYRIPVSMSYFVGSLAYGFFLIAFFVWISCFSIRGREVQ